MAHPYKGKNNPLNTKHNLSKHRIYRLWASVKNRCYNSNEPSYASYGARGVRMCDEWVDSPEVFIAWALANGWQDGLQIDKDIRAKELGLEPLLYSPLTCLFVTPQQNSNLRRDSNFLTFNGKTQTLIQWSREVGIKHTTIGMRILNYGWSVEDALTIPAKAIKSIKKHKAIL